MKPDSLVACCVAEAVGTGILVFFGCGSVHTAVLFSAQMGLWQVAIVWALSIMLAIFLVGGVSGAHINPAITLALASCRKFAWSRVGPYIVSQFVGAIAAASLLLVLFNPHLQRKEAQFGVVRGEPGSEITAMCYGEYFPNPDLWVGGPPSDSLQRRSESWTLVPASTAFLAEFLGTLVLAAMVFALTDPDNQATPLSRLAPVFIGLTVAMLISVLAPLTQAGFNPARDFGPRIVAFFAGWGSIAFPGPRPGVVLIYGLAPIAGAVVGGLFYLHLIKPSLLPAEPEDLAESLAG